MVPQLEDLVGPIKARITDPVRQVIAVELALDIAQIQARKLGGEDVEREMVHARSQALSLTATEAGVVLDVVMARLHSIGGVVARGALAAVLGAVAQ